MALIPHVQNIINTTSQVMAQLNPYGPGLREKRKTLAALPDQHYQNRRARRKAQFAAEHMKTTLAQPQPSQPPSQPSQQPAEEREDDGWVLV